MNRSKYVKPRISKEEELALTNSEIERVKQQMKEEAMQFPSIPNDISDEKKGELLLEAFLKDEPFDRYVFAYMNIKIAFLNAAFRTCDPEIIAYALLEVKSTLDNRAFDQILDSAPQFRGAFEYLSKPKVSGVLRDTKKMQDEEKLDYLEDELKKSSGFMKEVIKDEIARSKGRPLAGKEEVDLKFEKIVSMIAAGTPGYINAKEMTSKFKLVNKWKVNVSPMQGALFCRAFNYPQAIVQEFASLVTDAKEKVAMVEEYGIRPGP
ncbi:hypothetical protein TRFO_32097 [Tritrichomonas foetus]|uniref:Uncharacterized protein n=1 Tax=Tritrichomonas foetus TaxID=1144522 RepID=A0A1J4JV78_9EUKA|nr:hypothetical protein TRFO_32097 [Tritrichomonas foetus]|eukprot:OHT01165.1 hypothetical protein TRFO_32097 [Tritrichomonas foetus]